jgi:hypothetical protein
MNTSRTGHRAGSDSRARSSHPGPRESVPLQPSLPDETSNAAKSQASQAAGAAASLTADVKEAAKSASRAVRQQASELAANVGQELSKSAENQKTRGVEAIQNFSHAIRSAAEQLDSQSPQLARSVHTAAEKVEGLSQNLRNQSVDDLLKAATDLARSQPMLFIGGAVAAGFAMARFLKSSAPSRPAADDQLERS